MLKLERAAAVTPNEMKSSAGVRAFSNRLAGGGWGLPGPWRLDGVRRR